MALAMTIPIARRVLVDEGGPCGRSQSRGNAPIRTAFRRNAYLCDTWLPALAEAPEPARSEGGEGRLAGGTIGSMSQAEPVTNREVAALDEEERAWLDERLVEYDELLTYLREH